MESLPFAKRPPRRPVDTTVRERGVFDPINYNPPLNLQQYPQRRMQYGAYNQRNMKITVRAIDSRKDIVDRDRNNLFSDTTRTSKLPDVKTPPSLERTTRHMHVPYDYYTGWISHPDKNTSLYPTQQEEWKTSYLATPTCNYDRIRKKQEEANRIDTIHYYDQKVSNYYNQYNEDIKRRDQRMMSLYKDQRANYQKALEIRQQREKIRFFE